MTATQHMEIRVARFARSDVNLSGNSRAGAIEAERTLADRDAHLEHLLEAMVTGYPTCLHCSIICSVISNYVYSDNKNRMAPPRGGVR